MSDCLEEYRKPTGAAPAKTLAWRLHGAGMENFGRDQRPEELPVLQPGPREVLLRVDALGLCLSDTKLIAQGGQHARVYGRDLAADPVIPGHEPSVTVIAVGAEYADRFKVGERYIVQADAIFHGEARAYGYALPGGMTQYSIVNERIVDGDEGCYLIPIRADIGYAEAALTEPWACVVASYRITQRDGLRPGGTALFLALPDAKLDDYTLSRGMDAGSAPAKIVAVNVAGKFGEWLRARAAEIGVEVVDAAAADMEALKAQHAPKGFDDVVVLGAADPDAVEAAARTLALGGVMNIVADQPLPRPLQVDVGRIHYDNTDYVGNPGLDIAASYAPRVSEFGDGPAWVIGGGGPMGQMHVQRALEKAGGPQVVVASDVDDARLAAVETKYRATAEARGKQLIILNPTKLTPAEFDAALREVAPQGFTDIGMMAPAAALIQQAVPYLAVGGTFNIFAGMVRGTMATLDLSGVYLRGARFVGSSGSKIADMEFTLRATERGELSPNLSVGAVGDMTAVYDGLAAVKSGAFAGKVVVYPHVHGLPLTSMSELKDRLPEVYAKLGPGESWTREAEQELLRLKLGGCR